MAKNKKRGRKAQPIKQNEIIDNLYNSKNYDKLIKKIIDNTLADFDVDYDTKVNMAKYTLDTQLKEELLDSYSSKGDAKKAVNNVIDSLTMSADDLALKKAKQDAKKNDVTNFDFRQLNKKNATYTALDNKELDPQDLQSTADATKVSVEGYYDFGNGYAIIKAIVSMPHGSPMSTSILVSSDVLGRIHDAV